MKKIFLKIASVMAMTMAVFFGSSCVKEEVNGIDDKAKGEIVPVSWTPTKTTYTMHVGETISVEGILVFSNGQETVINGHCSSLNPEIIRANNGMSALAVGLGSAKMTAFVRFSNPKDVSEFTQVFESEISVEVVAEQKAISKLELSPSEITLARGESFTYKVTAIYEDGKRKEIDPTLCEWSAEDDGSQHLTYGFDGKVTGHQGNGETIITATYSKEGTIVKASSRVIVEERNR